MKTFEEVGKSAGLDSNTLKRYVYYLRVRWADEEDQQCKEEDGYAKEWALRFKEGIEFAKSDILGQALLHRMTEAGL